MLGACMHALSAGRTSHLLYNKRFTNKLVIDEHKLKAERSSKPSSTGGGAEARRIARRHESDRKAAACFFKKAMKNPEIPMGTREKKLGYVSYQMPGIFI